MRQIGHNAMLEQDAVHIGCEADLAAHVLDVQGRQLSVKGLLETGAVVEKLDKSDHFILGRTSYAALMSQSTSMTG